VAVEGRLGKEQVYFFRGEDGTHSAFVGVDLEAKPGLVKVKVHGTTPSGLARASEIPLRIKTKAFHTESFSVADEFDQLSPEVLQRINADRERFARAFASTSPTRLWVKPFVLPISSDITSPFGYRRVINGVARAPHSGVDFKAALGTVVQAANHGRVVLRGEFFYAGKSVVLDHGGGLQTLYFHLSEVKVEEGAAVRQGEVIALSGMTGRASGPHLHWAARLNNARIDPLELIGKLGAKVENKSRPGAAGETMEK
jgi:murein DD-endopeptidase MepM/ murein hydrolase activator NlpD